MVLSFSSELEWIKDLYEEMLLQVYLQVTKCYHIVATYCQNTFASLLSKLMKSAYSDTDSHPEALSSFDLQFELKRVWGLLADLYTSCSVKTDKALRTGVELYVASTT